MDRPRLSAAVLSLLTGAFAGFAVAGDAPPPQAPWEALLQALAPYQTLDTQSLARAAMEAALHRVDPQARFLPHAAPEPPAETNTALLAGAELWPEQIVRLDVRGLYALDAEGVDVVRRWLVPKPEGLLLDLRGAGGDDLATLDALGGLFVADGTPLYTLRDGRGQVLTTRVARAQSPAPPLPPTVVLVDGNTRGTSEALAAILRDHAGLLLVGTNTCGDAARRERIPFTANEDILIATHAIYPTSGLDYRHSGVVPQIYAAQVTAPPATTASVARATSAEAPTNAPAAAEAMPEVPSLAKRVGDDTVLRRAVDILLGLQALRKP